MIGGGVGLTGLLSVWKEFLKRSTALQPKKVRNSLFLLPLVPEIVYRTNRTVRSKVVLVWSVREVDLAIALFKEEFEDKLAELQENIEENGVHPKRLYKFLSKDSDDIRFEYSFHITSKTMVYDSKETFETSKANLNLPLSHLWKFGRPNYQHIFSRILHFASNKSYTTISERIGLIVCGPSAMVSDVVDTANRFSASIPIDIHEEVFEL